MEFWKVLQKRRSIRKFQDKKIPDDLIKKILAAGILAPSEGNLQPWYFVVVKEPALKKALKEAAGGQSQLEEAPVVIVICIDLEIASSKYAERGLELYAKQSTAAAAENMFLAATDLGLGACWVGAFDEARVREILELEEKYRPVILLALGYKREEGIFWPRRKIEEVSHWL